MKAHRPNTDQEAEFTVVANGFACTEYVLPFGEPTDPNVVECFVPVSSGDQITIEGSFKGTVLHGCFDLLVDGSYLADRRIEGSKTGEAKYSKSKKVQFLKVLDTPKPPGYTSIYPPRQVVEGNLHVKVLEDLPVQEFLGSKLGVGSIAIIISVNRDSDQNYFEKYADITCGEWHNRVDLEEAADGGIIPDFECEVKVLDEDVHKNRQSKHRRHWEQNRFGDKPWAKFVFYYRSRNAIEDTGCVLRSEDSQALEAAKVGQFMQADTQKKAKKKETEEQTMPEGDDPSATGVLSRAGGLFNTPPPPSLTEGMMRSKRLGDQSTGSGPTSYALNGSAERLGDRFMNTDAGRYDSQDLAVYDGYPNPISQSQKNGQDASGSTVNAVDSLFIGEDEPMDTFDAFTDEQLAQWTAEAQQYLGNRQLGFLPGLSTPTDTTEQEHASKVERVEDLDLGPRPAGLTYADVQLSYPHQPDDMRVDPRSEILNRHVKTSSEWTSLPPKVVTSNSNNKVAIKSVAPRQEPINIDISTQSAPSPATMSPRPPTDITIPTKRSASMFSRESTPNKQARPSEHAAKKASLLAALEQKKKNRAAAFKAAEEQRRLLEEAEAEERRRQEAEARELEELERLCQAEDEETARYEMERLEATKQLEELWAETEEV